MYEQFAGYELIALLAESLTGRVHLAQSPGTGQLWAIKEMLLERESALSEEEQRLRFEREIRIHTHFDHPNIVRAHGGGCWEGRSFLVCDYQPGTTLQTLMDAGPPPMTQVIEWGIQLCAALHYIYDTFGLVHRDIKPANIIISPSGQLKITDFGLARVALHPEITQAKMLLGTLVYMSPEQLLDPTMVDNRTDIFAVGAVLFRALTGVLPFGAEKLEDMARRLLYDKPSDMRELNPLLPPELSEVVMRCLSKDAQERYPHARMLADDLQNALKSPAVHLAQGKIHAQKLEWRDASASFQRAAALAPESAPAWFALGDALERQGQIDPALDCYLKVIGTDTGAVEAYRRLGRTYALRPDVAAQSAALKMFERAWTLEPGDLDLGLNLAEIRVALGLDAEAVDLVSELIKRHPGCSRAHFIYGRLLYKADQLPGALSAFKTSYRLDPTHFETLFNLASLAFELGYCHEAEELYLRAIALDTSRIEGQHNLAMLYLEGGRHREAEDLLRMVLAQQVSMASLALLGKVLLAQGRHFEAVEPLREAVSSGASWELQVQLAEAYSGAFRYVEAIAVLQEAVAKAPQSEQPMLHLQLARVARTAGNPDEAIIAARACLAAFPPPEVATKATEILSLLKTRNRGVARMHPATRQVSPVWRLFGVGR